MTFIKSYFTKALFFLIIFSCVEPIEIENLSFDNLLVVEASITNQLKKHHVQLSRTFQLNDDSIKNETGATVTISNSNGTIYTFTEVSNGQYESSIAFQATNNNTYTLNITTKDGNTYSSTPETLTATSQINCLSTNIEASTDGLDGVAIYVESSSTNESAKYYRYTFEETYKITPPFWSDKELMVISNSFPYRVAVVEKTIENKNCYKTLNSTDILVAETASLEENSVIFPVNFMLDTNFKIAERYSILVKQFVITPSAYNYFNTLKRLSSSDNVFAQSQPGFISGNISSNNNENEKTIGFFQVSTVSEKRLFFNFADVFPDKTFEYPYDCDFAAPILYDSFSQSSPLVDLINRGSYTYYSENNLGQSALEGPYLMVPSVCGDCTVLGSNVKPEFWID
ncbi:DUF4249 domain-containing protein [Polaribacter sp. R77954]|uniref:DUF4249 domain-containing protein n=1 Tax=Polaribacter sp. R77954 TaxID=3093870 RepID=UPI0037C733D9